MPADAGAAPALRLRDVGKRFGRTWALRSVDLDVQAGQLVALIGPNGAGKTTLLKAVGGLHRATTGTTEVLGFGLPEDEDLVRVHSTLLPPHGYLYEQLTGLENLRFARLMAGVRPSRDELDRALERVDLVDAGDERVGGYSSGMRKRLAIARLLLRPVELVLMDEPYASLDAGGIDLVDTIIGELKASGATVLVASHRWERAIREADRLVVMERGRITWTGTPAAWTERREGPADARRGRGDDAGSAPGARGADDARAADAADTATGG